MAVVARKKEDLVACCDGEERNRQRGRKEDERPRKER